MFGPLPPEPEPRKPRYESLPPLGMRRDLRRMHVDVAAALKIGDEYMRLVATIQQAVLAIALSQDGAFEAGVDEGERAKKLSESYSWRAGLATVEYHPREDSILEVAPQSLVISGMRGRLARKVAGDFGRSTREVEASCLHIDVPEIGLGRVGSRKRYANSEMVGAAQVSATLRDHDELKRSDSGPQAVTTYADLERFMREYRLFAVSE